VLVVLVVVVVVIVVSVVLVVVDVICVVLWCQVLGGLSAVETRSTSRCAGHCTQYLHV